MKVFSKIIPLVAVMLIGLTACVEKEPDYSNFDSADVDFTYNVEGEEYTLDFYVVSTIQFNNTSSKSGNVSWDFGDGTTSTEQNPLHKYAEAGLYQVKLTVEGVGSRTYPLLIYDITPVMSITEQSAEEVIINEVSVKLDIALPNPENLVCKYVWKFPEGTLDENGNLITEDFVGYSHEDGTIDNPGSIRFRNIGSQRIELQTWFDVNGENRRLEDAYVNVQVGYTEPVPTVYYAVVGGNIKAYKIIPEDQLPEGTKNMPFDMGVTSGNMPMQLVCATIETSDEEGGTTETDYIYILDAGKQFTYINDESDTNGDGQITVMSADGSYADVMVTNAGRQAFNDPFQGCTDGTYLYYTDRNTGVRQLALTTRGATESTQYESEAGYLVVNNTLGYYSNAGHGGSIAYGAGNGDIQIDSNGVFYWVKSFNGSGIYRFTRADIGDLTKLPQPQLFTNTNPKSIAIDEGRNKLYVWQRSAYPAAGLMQYDLPAIGAEGPNYASTTARVEMNADPMTTAASEEVTTTQLALDEETGNVWFGFRASTAERTYTTGLYYFDYNTNKVVNYCGNTESILGVTINPRKTRLY